MVRKRHSIDEETNKNQIDCDDGYDSSGDSDRRNAINGYRKLVLWLFLFAAILLCKTFVADMATVTGVSMENTFVNGDVLLMRPSVDELGRGDIVVAKVGRIKVIKRVIGLPNETIQIVDGKVLINGVVLEESYCGATTFAGVASEPYLLADGEYFLMGDNRGDSEDSRAYGGVLLEDIRGIITFKLYPFNGFGTLNNGYDENNEG